MSNTNETNAAPENSLVAAGEHNPRHRINVEFVNARLMKTAQELTDLQAPGQTVREVVIDFEDSTYSVSDLIDEALAARGQSAIGARSGSVEAVTLEPIEQSGDLNTPTQNVFIVQEIVSCGDHSHVEDVPEVEPTYNVDEAIVSLNKLSEEHPNSKFLIFSYPEAA